MNVLPAGAMHMRPPIAVNAMPDPDDATQRLDVEMHELAGPRPLVAGDGRGRLERGQLIQTESRENRRDRGARDLQPHSDRPRCEALVAGGHDGADHRRRCAPRLPMRLG